MNSWRILHLFLRWQHGEGSVQREQIVVIIDGLVRQMVTMKPLYNAPIIFLLLPSLTNHVPIIDVSIQAPPIDKG